MAKQGRPNIFGKNNENKEVIAQYIKNIDNISQYYIKKLIDMGLVEYKLTAQGEKFISD